MGGILITGGAGGVATMIRPLLAAPGRSVVLLDLAEPELAPFPGESVVLASINDLDALVAACAGIELVVHLAGFASERPWADILSTNIDGTHTVLEAARRAGVPRVLLASSIHAVGMATAGEAKESGELTPRPDTFYGVGKVALEALGRLYGDRYGMTVVSARIGTAQPHPSNERALSTWVSPADLARLVEAVAALDAPGGYVVWAVSANSRRWTTTGSGEALGFTPLDDAEHAAPALAEREPLPLPLKERLGGAFTTNPVGESW